MIVRVNGLLESVCELASPVVRALQEVVRLMNCAIEEDELRQKGRPRITIGEEQLGFLVKNGFRITDIANFFQCNVLLN